MPCFYVLGPHLAGLRVRLNVFLPVCEQPQGHVPEWRLKD